MKVVYSDQCVLHHPKHEMTSGEWKPYVESPQRWVAIKTYLQNQSDFELVQSADYSLQPLHAIYPAHYLHFLQTIYTRWVSHGLPADACMGETHPVRRTPAVLAHAQRSPTAHIGYYTSDLSICFDPSTWTSTYASVQVALTAAHQMLLHGSAYALCRPPGHHASDAVAAGYCFMNNVAIAARFLQQYSLQAMQTLRQGQSVLPTPPLKKILIVDIDYHHGNGTQEIFYEDPSVFYLSLHASPAYPHFSGSAEETGQGAGLGYTLNVPLDASTTTDASYLDALRTALAQIHFEPDYVLVSLGLDTWHEDPIAGMKGLKDPATYLQIGKLLQFAVPVLFIQEGGYTLDRLGELVGHVLRGYSNK